MPTYPQTLDRGTAAGRYAETVTIQSRAESVNAAGQDEPTWSTYVTRRADVHTSRSREYVGTHQRRAVRTFLIRIRKDSETELITPDYRVSWAGVTLEIEAAAPLLSEVVIVATQATSGT